MLRPSGSHSSTARNCGRRGTGPELAEGQHRSLSAGDRAVAFLHVRLNRLQQAGNESVGQVRMRGSRLGESRQCLHDKLADTAVVKA